jgi:hypothetical protein
VGLQRVGEAVVKKYGFEVGYVFERELGGVCKPVMGVSLDGVTKRDWVCRWPRCLRMRGGVCGGDGWAVGVEGRKKEWMG